MNKVTYEEANNALLNIICLLDNLALCGALIDDEDEEANEAIGILNRYIHQKEDN